jgi:hypothetical protein
MAELETSFDVGAFGRYYSEVGFDTVHTLSKTWEGGTVFRAGDSGMGENPYRETGEGTRDNRE